MTRPYLIRYNDVMMINSVGNDLIEVENLLDIIGGAEIPWTYEQVNEIVIISNHNMPSWVK